MEYCIVSNGTIINIVTCDSDEAAATVGAVPSYAGACIGSNYAPPATDNDKQLMIEASKAMLENYLTSHPLLWTDGEYYAITKEKQNQLTSKIMAATMAQTMRLQYELKWNSTGEKCTVWTLSDLSALAFAIDKRVTSLVEYQQAKEIEIREATTQEELDAIEVDYDTVQ